MFNPFKRRLVPMGRVRAADDGRPVIAALLLDEDGYPLEDLADRAGAAVFGGVRPVGVECEDGFLSFALGDDTVGVMHMPAQYPWADLEGPAQTARNWPRDTPATSMASHRTHLLVTMVGGKSPALVRRLAVARLTELASHHPSVMGIYWGEATMLHHPKAFQIYMETLNTPESPPLPLLVDFRVGLADDGGAYLFTVGLEALGLMEMEATSLPMTPAALGEWAQDIVFYLISEGKRLGHGETVGPTAAERYKISHRKSAYARNITVVHIAP